ncbi:hypothetical protein NDU88_001982 [Pleurodeles waltl]|uniref:Uncharacterized protein n=1 Tax=Pleurodeles waltl TaxID=8319 RepID=A0AAV7V988_PLEWA|nr:hypothetical protein NDU88_001982 [Pleurodeles waltl]
MGRAGHLDPGRQRCLCVYIERGGVYPNGIPRLKDRRVDSWVVIVWAYFCWRDGLVIASFSLPFGVADLCGCLYFGGLPVVGQNDCGGLPRRYVGGLLTAVSGFYRQGWNDHLSLFFGDFLYRDEPANQAGSRLRQAG